MPKSGIFSFYSGHVGLANNLVAGLNKFRIDFPTICNIKITPPLANIFPFPVPRIYLNSCLNSATPRQLTLKSTFTKRYLSLMENYNIITLGASGVGKTVFLASLYKHYSIPKEGEIYLDVQDDKQRRKLNNIDSQVAMNESWPRGTTGEVTKWNFTCCVNRMLNKYQVFKFTYLDYAGTLLTDLYQNEGPSQDISQKVREADTVIVLIDGQQLFKFIQADYDLSAPGIRKWLLIDLPNTIQLAQLSKKEAPVHFVITKWDLLQEHYNLWAIKECLIDKSVEFKRLVALRVKAGCPVRLIPISSVGKEFVTMQTDGSMKKNLAEVPKPLQLEIPLSYVLIDMAQAFYNNADKDYAKIIKSAKNKFRVLFELIPNSFFRGTQLTLAQRIELLKNVIDDKTAFSYLIESCAQIIKDFEKNFPDSNLGVEINFPNPPVKDGASTTFSCSQKQFDNLIKNLKTWFDQQSFQHQTIKKDEFSILIQIAKKGGWRQFTGMSQALNIQLTHQKQKLKVQLSGGKLIERLAPAGIIAVLEASLLPIEVSLLPIIGIPIVIGAWQQFKLPKEIISFISNKLT